MTGMECGQVTEVLDDWLARRLDPARSALVEAHVAGCASCRLDAEAARAVEAALPSLPREVPPARNLWTGVERRITAPRPHRVRTALIAATVLLAGAVGLWSAWQVRAAPSPATAPAQLSAAEAAAAELEAQRQSDASLPAAVRAALDRDLRIVDAAIRDAKAQLQATPGDPVAQALVESAVRKKLGLLRRVGDFTS